MILRGNVSTFVCSRHFTDADYTSATGRKRLRKGAVPSRFLWNNWGETSGESVYERVRARHGLDACPILSSDDDQEDDGDIVPEVTAGSSRLCSHSSSRYVCIPESTKYEAHFPLSFIKNILLYNNHFC